MEIKFFPKNNQELVPLTSLPQKKLGKFLFLLYIGNLFLSFHLFLILYINSSFLEQFFSSTVLSGLFIVGSIVSLILLFKASNLIESIGIYNITIISIILESLSVLGMSLSNNHVLLMIAFIVHLAVVTMILFSLDIFLEEYSPIDETKTGSIRGTFLTISNVTLVIAPTITGFILSFGDFSGVYLVSFLFLIPFFLIVLFGFRNQHKKIKDQTTQKARNEIDIKKSISNLLKNKNLYGGFMMQFILQFFYAWMIIYTPIHLHQNLGISWSDIGLIFTVMLLPFALFELPLGKLEDKNLGEKEVLITGFIITTLSVVLIAFIQEPNLILWASILFITRTGASFIEISSESYFFKHVNSKNSDIISVFRMSRPLSFIVAPLIAAPTIFILKYLDLPYRFSFLILSLVVLCGIYYSLIITDTKKEKTI